MSTGTSGILSLASESSSHVWTIDNFSAWGGSELKSPCFSMRTTKTHTRCCLYLYQKIDIRYIPSAIFLSMSMSNADGVTAKITISILNSSDEKTNTTDITGGFVKLRNCTLLSKKQIIKTHFLLDNLKVMLPGDNLRIHCEVDVLNTSNCKTKEVELDIPSCRLLEDVGSLYQDHKFSDVTLSVGESEFPAHKNILAARSHVFQAMFTHKMEETMQNRVNITDIDGRVIKEMLRFIYTGEASDLQHIAADLLIAADKYALERLKGICEKELCSKFSTENVVEMLILGYRHNACQLKAKAIDFFKLHGAKVIDSPEWDAMNRYPHLLQEILRAFFKSINIK